MASLPALPAISQSNSQKKPRHRHSPAQLAALNELYDKNEHPPLDQRTALAERLGMETKTVNAWFQNKRASSKKRTRSTPYEQPPISAPEPHHALSNAVPHYPQPEYEDYNDEDFPTVDIHHSRAASVVPPEILSSFYTDNPEHTHFLTEGDSMPRRMRMRPSVEQTDELRKLYNINPHPTTEQRQVLSERIGMRYQSITNWFQNQRSLAKKRKDEEDAGGLPLTANSEYMHDMRQYAPFPPPPDYALPSSLHPSLHRSSRAHRSLSLSADEASPRRSSSRHSTAPYGNSTFSRPRRSRPEPYQLEALKELYTRTATPSIEERMALALEIGMEVGKVTNWFRNLRQTARKRSKKSGSGDDDDYGGFPGLGSYSTSVSRSGTPSLRSSPSSMNDDSMDLDRDYGSDDDFEAVTPPPEPSPSPPPPSVPNSHISLGPISISNRPAYLLEQDKISNQFSGAKIEDALLLLSFHHHVVH
ncbi:hypothetical protein BDQ12DRAFT_696454 [Crucibulum laeve]|uniref:Homeobox domain-containing protein n=1 Tax=Crucibulum laeve TaxID=68775 RepID=A0A5C3M9H1_9AGAR|nr:hypothetical protein BDQ12DRAFT_696454 [Crucibulum laeve]